MTVIRNTRTKGAQAEDHACAFLQQCKLKLIERNYQCLFGEIDLIMRDRDDTLVFIEVRSRKNLSYADPIESISWAKQKKIIKSATHYLQKRKWFDKVHCRFDVVGITGDQLEWIKNAFSINFY